MTDPGTFYYEGDPAELSAPIKQVGQKEKLVEAFCNARGLFRYQLDSFDDLCDNIIPEIVKASPRITCDANPNFFFRFKSVRIGKPTLLDGAVSRSTTPHECRLRDMTYAANVFVDVQYVRFGADGSGASIHTQNNVILGKMPIMLRSKRCILHGLSSEALMAAQECPLDPGGYFVVRGTEKVILMQEQLSKNRIILERDAKGDVSTSVHSSTHLRQTKCTVVDRGAPKGMILRHNSFTDDVPIILVFKAMGVVSDQEILSLVGSDPATLNAMAASIAACPGVHSQEQALDRLGRLVRAPMFPSRVRKPGFGEPDTLRFAREQAAETLANVVLSHIPTPGADAIAAAAAKAAALAKAAAQRDAATREAVRKAGARGAKSETGALLPSAPVPGAASLSGGDAAAPVHGITQEAWHYYDFRPKTAFLAVMLRRVVASTIGDLPLDDKDYFGNKRIELAGDLLALLFEDLFMGTCATIRREAEMAFRGPRGKNFDALAALRSNRFSEGFTQAISSGNWRIRRFRMDRIGVTQVLSRLSYISAIGMITRVNSQFDKTRKVAGPRALQPSQIFLFCPSDTPEGESCGLVKNFSLLACVTREQRGGTEALRAQLYNHGVEELSLVSGDAITPNFLVFLDGEVLGIHRRPAQLLEKVRALRRCGHIGQQTSVYVNEITRSVHVAADGGRLCRPLIVVEHGRSLVTQSDLLAVAGGYRSFDDLLREGKIEFLDVNEENAAYIALREHAITEDTTHLEIEPFSLYGLCAGLIPYPHHNQSPRNTYQCAMGKQAMGAIAHNALERLDTLMYLLVYPQKPLVKTKIIDLDGFNALPAGQNASVAVMSFSGYDIEDAIVINQSSIDRGYGRCIVYKKMGAELREYDNGTIDRIVGPPVDSVGEGRWHALEADGVAGQGALLSAGDVYINKQMPANLGADDMSGGSTGVGRGAAGVQYRPCPLSHKGSIPIYVNKMLVTSNDFARALFKVQSRETRIPELGDKFSSRHGQKGVCGSVVCQGDFPFNHLGICPDMIMNPHGFPSRMTVGKMLELVAGKAGVLNGHQGDGTIFGGDKIDDIAAELLRYGFNFSGKDVLTSGITGEPMKAYVFFGPIYYQKLKHMVRDKMHARAKGPRAVLTRQPTEGRSRDGGLRLGEMERDALIAYGASNLIVERLSVSSDRFTTHVCERCGMFGYVAVPADASRRAAAQRDAAALRAPDGRLTPEQRAQFEPEPQPWCQHCRTGRHMATMQLPYACKLLLQEMVSMGIAPRIRLQDATD
jgi:DNA-directed RNA polymerase III subunit RPC2